jgi:hypothetical protein
MCVKEIGLECDNVNWINLVQIHVPIVNITKFHKGVYISGIKVFNYLTQVIKNLANNEKSFKLILKRFLSVNIFNTRMTKKVILILFTWFLMFILLHCFIYCLTSSI